MIHVRILLMALIIVLFALPKTFCQTIVTTDVCVYGGTSAGVIAAYTTKKLGKNSVLIEPGKFLGGMTAGGLGYTDIGNKYAITGLSRDFYRRIGKHYGVFEQWIFEPKVASTLFNDYISRGDFPVYYEKRVKSVTKNGTAIVEIVIESSTEPSPATDIVVRAKMFIDCSYEGDLMAKSGVSYFVGRESNALYKETYSGFQLRTNHQFPDGIDPYVVPGQPSSGLVWGVSNGTVVPAGTGDNRVQAYNYRMCLTTDPANKVAITMPNDYDPARYELISRLLAAAPAKKALANYFIISKMPGNKTDMNHKGGFSLDMIGMNHDYPDANYDQRKLIVKAHEDYTKGLLYFLGHDLRVPIQTRNEMLTYGYPADEYVLNGNWSPQLYVREARRMVGNYVMTQANCKGQKVVTDGIGMAAYTMDSHHVQRIIVNGMVKNEGCVEVGGFGPYPIAYNSIIPKPADCNNILVPVCLSASHIAYGSIRMEPVFMVLAQSAATAAVMAINANTSVHGIDIVALQQKLISDPLADGSIFEVLVDNSDNINTGRAGTWSLETAGAYGPNCLINDGLGDSATMRFTPDIPREGVYETYAYFPKVAGISTQTKVMVFDGRSQTSEILVREADIRVAGQTTGAWVPLGSYNVPQGKNAYVEVTSKDADGKVVADAVVWIPVMIVPTDTLRDPENPTNTVAGLNYQYYEGVWSVLPNFNVLTPVETGPIANINLYPKNRDDDYAFRFSGYFNAPTDGTYTFYTTSDEGSKLLIGNTVVVNNDGLHTAAERSGKIALNAGKHLFSVLFFERLGSASLAVRYAGPGIQKQVIPNTAYFRLSSSARSATHQESLREEMMTIYPNPAKTLIKVSVRRDESQSGSRQVRLLDSVGKEIRDRKASWHEGEGAFLIDVRNMQAGLYIVELSTSIGTERQKVFIQE